MRSNGRSGRRWAAVVIGAFLAVTGLASSGSAEQSVLVRASTGPTGGNDPIAADWSGASADGTRVFFVTKEQLVSADTDSAWDVYRRSSWHTTLISTGPTGGNGPVDALYMGASADGTRVFLETYESLVNTDTDARRDVYERAGGHTTLISTGPEGGNGPVDAYYRGVTGDGMRVFFETWEPLVSADTERRTDVYERVGGETTLISTGPTGGNGPAPSYFRGASADGTRVFFQTYESLASPDGDWALDVYERAGGETTLISTGPTGGNHFAAFYRGAAADATRVFFETSERLVSADTDSALDVYERAGGETTLISTGPTGGNGPFNTPFVGMSADGTRVFFETYESLVRVDTDSRRDVYERAGGETTLISTGPTGGNGPVDAFYTGASADGTRVYFATWEPLVRTDTERRRDVYERAGGETTLISTGPTGGNGPIPSYFGGRSADGTRVFFRTYESLVSADIDGSQDVYERAGGETTLISTGPTGGNGPVDAFYTGASADGTRVSFETAESLLSGDTDQAVDIYVRRIVAP